MHHLWPLSKIPLFFETLHRRDLKIVALYSLILRVRICFLQFHSLDRNFHVWFCVICIKGIPFFFNSFLRWFPQIKPTTIPLERFLLPFFLSKWSHTHFRDMIIHITSCTTKWKFKIVHCLFVNCLPHYNPMLSGSPSFISNSTSMLSIVL